MLLAIDVGNTQTVIGMFQDGELVEHWRLATEREATADMLAHRLAGLLELRDLRLRDVDAAIVSSVVPVLGHEYEELSERYLAGALALVGPELKIGMPIRVDNPHEVGADRLVNSVAAYDRCGGACIVVDFGTTINFDVVSRRRRVPRRGVRPGRGDLDRGAGPAGGAAVQGRPRAARAGDRQEHRAPRSSRA